MAMIDLFRLSSDEVYLTQAERVSAPVTFETCASVTSLVRPPSV